MFHHKINIIFTAIIILLLSVVSVVQAAPPVNGFTFGETLDLDEGDAGDTGDEDDTSGGYNLGSIMSGRKDASNTDDTSDGDGTDDEADQDDPDEDEDNEDDDDTGDATDDPSLKQHPVATALAEYFDVPYEEIMTLHEAGNGFGTITKAYFFGEKLGLAPAELLDAAKGTGWGNVLKQNNIHPGSVGNGNGHNKDWKSDKPDPSEDLVGNEKAGPPGQLKKGDSPNLRSPNAPNLVGQGGESGNKSDNGHGNGSGGENGRGHGRGRGKK